MSNNLMAIIVILITVGGCGCLLPILSIYFKTKTDRNKTNRKTEIMLKAIENGQQIDPKIFEDTDPVKKNIKISLLNKLKSGIAWALVGAGLAIAPVFLPFKQNVPSIFLIGGIFCLAMGTANIVFYIVGHRQLKGEMEAELKKAEAEAARIKALN